MEQVAMATLYDRATPTNTTVSVKLLGYAGLECPFAPTRIPQVVSRFATYPKSTVPTYRGDLLNMACFSIVKERVMLEVNETGWDRIRRVCSGMRLQLPLFMATVTDVEELEVLGSYVTFPASFHDSPVIASACSLLLDVSYMLHQITPTCEPVTNDAFVGRQVRYTFGGNYIDSIAAAATFSAILDLVISTMSTEPTTVIDRLDELCDALSTLHRRRATNMVAGTLVLINPNDEVLRSNVDCARRALASAFVEHVKAEPTPIATRDKGKGKAVVDVFLPPPLVAEPGFVAPEPRPAAAKGPPKATGATVAGVIPLPKAVTKSARPAAVVDDPSNSPPVDQALPPRTAAEVVEAALASADLTRRSLAEGAGPTPSAAKATPSARVVPPPRPSGPVPPPFSNPIALVPTIIVTEPPTAGIPSTPVPSLAESSSSTPLVPPTPELYLHQAKYEKEGPAGYYPSAAEADAFFDRTRTDKRAPGQQCREYPNALRDWNHFLGRENEEKDFSESPMLFMVERPDGSITFSDPYPPGMPIEEGITINGARLGSSYIHQASSFNGGTYTAALLLIFAEPSISQIDIYVFPEEFVRILTCTSAMKWSEHPISHLQIQCAIGLAPRLLGLITYVNAVYAEGSPHKHDRITVTVVLIILPASHHSKAIFVYFFLRHTVVFIIGSANVGQYGLATRALETGVAPASCSFETGFYWHVPANSFIWRTVLAIRQRHYVFLITTASIFRNDAFTFQLDHRPSSVEVAHIKALQHEWSAFISKSRSAAKNKTSVRTALTSEAFVGSMETLVAPNSALVTSLEDQRSILGGERLPMKRSLGMTDSMPHKRGDGSGAARRVVDTGSSKQGTSSGLKRRRVEREGYMVVCCVRCGSMWLAKHPADCEGVEPDHCHDAIASDSEHPPSRRALGCPGMVSLGSTGVTLPLQALEGDEAAVREILSDLFHQHRRFLARFDLAPSRPSSMTVYGPLYYWYNNLDGKAITSRAALIKSLRTSLVHQSVNNRSSHLAHLLKVTSDDWKTDTVIICLLREALGTSVFQGLSAAFYPHQNSELRHHLNDRSTQHATAFSLENLALDIDHIIIQLRARSPVASFVTPPQIPLATADAGQAASGGDETGQRGGVLGGDENGEEVGGESRQVAGLDPLVDTVQAMHDAVADFLHGDIEAFFPSTD